MPTSTSLTLLNAYRNARNAMNADCAMLFDNGYGIAVTDDRLFVVSHNRSVYPDIDFYFLSNVKVLASHQRPCDDYIRDMIDAISTMYVGNLV